MGNRQRCGGSGDDPRSAAVDDETPTRRRTNALEATTSFEPAHFVTGEMARQHERAPRTPNHTHFVTGKLARQHERAPPTPDTHFVTGEMAGTRKRGLGHTLPAPTKVRTLGKMTASIDPHVDYRVEAPIATITLDRPEKLNAITFTMADAIVEHLDQATHDRSVRVVVLQGAGAAFTTGVDIEDHLEEQSPADKDLDTDRADIARAAARWLRLWSCPKPIIVKAHGWCAAWGLEIAMHADIVLAADDCRFFFPSVRNGAGLPDSVTAVYHLGPQWAKRLLFSGEIIDGRTAERIGLVCQAYPADELDAAVLDLARRIASIPAELVAQSKAIINQRVELMGRRALQTFAEHANATARRDPDVALFGQIMQRDGKDAAIAWREARFRT